MVRLPWRLPLRHLPLAMAFTFLITSRAFDLIDGLFTALSR
jgi:hypothetical protein